MANIHRHIGGLESNNAMTDKFTHIHRHIGGLENDMSY